MREAVRKYLAAFPGMYWSDVVPYALQALNLAPVRAHGFPPFTILTGSVPVLFSDAQLGHVEELPPDPTDAQVDQHVQQICTWVEQLREVA